MSEQHPDDIEQIARDALQARADQVEPSPDAYARLADKVTGAARRPAPWWQSPRLLWLGAASATAAVIAIALVATFAGDDNDETATATETPTPVVEPTPEPGGSPTPLATPEPVSDEVLWPLAGPALGLPELAVADFYTSVLPGAAPPALLETENSPSNPDERVFLVLPAGQDAPADPDAGDSVASIVATQVAPGSWAITQVVSGFIAVDPEPFDETLIGGTTVGSTDIPAVRIVRAVTDGSVVLDPVDVIPEATDGGGSRYIASFPSSAEPGDRIMVVASTGVFGPEAPAVAARWMTVPEGAVALDPVEDPTPTPTPIGGGADRNQGRPDGVIWPVDAIQPFGEWPNTPEDAAQQFVQQVGGWTLPVAGLEWLEPIQMIADVTLQSIGEDGEPFGTATVVRVVGGFDEAGVANWGAMSARSERIQLSRVFTDNGEFLVTGDGLAFEGTIDTRLVDANGNIAGEGFLTGGGVELAPIEGTVPITENLPGPGFAILSDVGGLGIAPTALTIVPIVLEEIDRPDPGTTSCSAEGLEPPAPDPELPDAVESTRQGIAAAAIACDWEALSALIDPTQFSFSFGADTDAIGFWEDVEGDALGEPMRFLVETLKLNWVLDELPPEAELPDNYIWPDAFPMIWDDVTPEMRDALRPLYDDQDFEGFANIGGFAGYRLAIDENGAWRYFLAGD